MPLQLRPFLIFEPIYNHAGELKAIELLTRFYDSDDNIIRFSDVIKLLSHKEMNLLFKMQIDTILENKTYLQNNNIISTVNVNETIADYLLSESILLNRISDFNFIHFEISEQFTQHIGSPETSILHRLSCFVPLWLDDVGSGYFNNFDLLMQGFFFAAKIDKNYFWYHQDNTGDKFGKTISYLQRQTKHQIIEGVESLGHLKLLTPFHQCWLQGYQFPFVTSHELQNIPIQIDLND